MTLVFAVKYTSDSRKELSDTLNHSGAKALLAYLGGTVARAVISVVTEQGFR